MEFARRGCRSLLNLGRANARPLPRSGGDKRHLVSQPHVEQLWLADSFYGYGSSTSSGRPLGVNGPRHFMPTEVAKVDEHLTNKPLLHTVTAGRLMVPDPANPYLLLEHTNCLAHSGLNIVYAANENGFSTKGLFTTDNVRIIPRSCVFGLKDVDQSSWSSSLSNTDRMDNFLEYIDFLLDLIEQEHGSQAISVLPPLFQDLQDLVKDMESEGGLLELIINYPGFLPIHSKGVVLRRLFNILLQRIPACKGKMMVEGFVPDHKNGIADVEALVTKLMARVPYTAQDKTNERWGTQIASRNADVFEVWSSATKTSTDSAEFLLRLLRVGASHPFETDMANAIMNKLKASRPSLATSQPTCTEVIQLLDGSFPLVTPRMARAFFDHHVYGWLGIPPLFRLLC